METSDKPDSKSSDLTKTKEYFENLLNPDWEDPAIKFLKACPIVNGVIQIPIGLDKEEELDKS